MKHRGIKGALQEPSKEHGSKDNIIDEVIDVLHGNFAPALIAIACGLLAFEIYCVATVAVPSLGADSTANVRMYSFGAFLLVPTLYFWVASMLKDPGRPSTTSAHSYSEDAASTRWCKICEGSKPPRAHHCRVCGRCVLKMDHHCPFTDNCVGLYNRREFLLFVVSGLLFWSFCLWCLFSSAIVVHRGSEAQTSTQRIRNAFHLATTVVVLGGAFALFHGYLILTNQTTIEFIAARQAKKNGKATSNVYDRGWQKNLLQTLRAPLKNDSEYETLHV